MNPETMEIIRKLAFLMDKLLYYITIAGFVGTILGIMIMLIAATREVRMKGLKLLVISVSATVIGFVYMLAYSENDMFFAGQCWRFLKLSTICPAFSFGVNINLDLGGNQLLYCKNSTVLTPAWSLPAGVGRGRTFLRYT